VNNLSSIKSSQSLLTIFQENFLSLSTHLDAAGTNDSGVNMTSFYFRAPKGSRKTLFLFELGKLFQADHEVFYFENAKRLDEFPKHVYEDLDKFAKEKRVVLLVDEAVGFEVVSWTVLLRGVKNIIIVAT